MDGIDLTQLDKTEVSRRSVLRKAAYTAPAVFAIAAAPKVALGKSGGGKKPWKPGKPRKPGKPGRPGRRGKRK